MADEPQAITQKPATRAELGRFFDGVEVRMGQDGRNGTNEASGAQVSQRELDGFFKKIGAQMGWYGRNGVYGSGQGCIDRHSLEQFFGSVERRAAVAERRQRCIDKRLATGFNVFDLIDPDENKLSDVLKILLDPEGDHGQGDLFLRLLLKQLDLKLDPRVTPCATVQREAPTYGIRKYRRRIDVFVDAGVLLAIENKVDSAEQQDQVKDYLEHLRRCTASRAVEWALIYLTPNGRSPDSLGSDVFEQQKAEGRLHCWSYPKELRAWLDQCRRECAARKIHDFLSDFMNYIESTLKRESEVSTEEEDNEE